jgi:hypothetical protein
MIDFVKAVSREMGCALSVNFQLLLWISISKIPVFWGGKAHGSLVQLALNQIKIKSSQVTSYSEVEKPSHLTRKWSNLSVNYLVKISKHIKP